MTNEEIATFQAVVQHGTMTAAAEALFITQPTLSGRIRELEAEVGAPLFRRGRGQRRITLTEAGERFLPLAQRWQHLLEETRAVGAAERREYLRIGAVFTTNQFILPPVYRRFLARRLPVSLWVHTVQGREAVEAVASGEMDMAILDAHTVFNDRVEVEPIFREEFFMICMPRSGYPDVVSPRELDMADEIMVSWRQEIVNWHDYWFGPDARPLLYTDTMQMATVFPQLENSWAIAPTAAAQVFRQGGHVRVCRFTAPPPDRISYLVRRKGEELTPAARQFLTDLRSHLQEVEGIRFYL